MFEVYESENSVRVEQEENDRPIDNLLAVINLEEGG